jgi:hypothetical protein
MSRALSLFDAVVPSQTSTGGYAVTGVPNFNVGEMVLRKTGFEARRRRNEKMITAMREPEKYLQEYAETVDELQESIGKDLKADLKRITEMGFDYGKAQEIALSKAERDLSSKMLLLNLEYPMAENEGLLASAAGGFDVRGSFSQNGGKKTKKTRKAIK